MIYGIQSGMVMQRNEKHLAEIWFTADREIDKVACLNDPQDITLEKLPDGRYHMVGLLHGGPYTLDVSGEIFEEIYVGDLWVLAGQSNMQGIGRTDLSDEYNSNPLIRSCFMDGRWRTANNPLHEMGLAIHEVHTTKLGAFRKPLATRIVGPGMAFARRMFQLTGVPQGLLPCAHGGSSMAQWDPALKELGTGESLYAGMLDFFKANGSHVKGMFWYQGCSEGSPEGRKNFTSNMVEFIRSVREDMGDIPVVQVQIGRHNLAMPCEDWQWQGWTDIREQQRTLNEHIDKLDTVHSIALELADNIHLEGKPQDDLGVSAAESMFCLLHGKLYGCVPGITLRSVECYADDLLESMTTLVLTYDNVHGELSGGPRPMGYVFTAQGSEQEFFLPLQCRVDGNRVILRLEKPLHEVKTFNMWYGVGRNPSCNIVDSRGRSLPAFGPYKL